MMPSSARKKGESGNEFALIRKNAHMRNAITEVAEKAKIEPDGIDVWRIGDTLWDVCDEEAYGALHGKLGKGGFIIRSKKVTGVRGWSVGVYLNSKATRDIVHSFCDDGTKEQTPGSAVYSVTAGFGGGGDGRHGHRGRKQRRSVLGG